MKTKQLFLTLLVFAISSCEYRDAQYILDVDPWSQAYAELVYDAQHLFSSANKGEIVKDNECECSNLPVGSSIHQCTFAEPTSTTQVLPSTNEHVECLTRESYYYYQDAKGRRVEILNGCSANNGMPYSLEPFYYVRSNGLVGFNWGAFFVKVWWYSSIFLFPIVILFLLLNWIINSLSKYLYKRMSHEDNKQV